MVTPSFLKPHVEIARCLQDCLWQREPFKLPVSLCLPQRSDAKRRNVTSTKLNDASFSVTEEVNDIRSSGISTSPKLSLMLQIVSHFTTSD